MYGLQKDLCPIVTTLPDEPTAECTCQYHHTAHLVDKVYQTEVLEQVVLDGCAGEQHSPAAVETHQRRVRLVLVVLQTVTLRTANNRRDDVLDCAIKEIKYNIGIDPFLRVFSISSEPIKHEH